MSSDNNNDNNCEVELGHSFPKPEMQMVPFDHKSTHVGRYELQLNHTYNTKEKKVIRCIWKLNSGQPTGSSKCDKRLYQTYNASSILI